MTSRWWLFSSVAFAIVSMAEQSAAQTIAVEEGLKRLVVMIQSVDDERTSNGAGVIFAHQGNRVYILTANHVVRAGLEQVDRVRVQFKWVPGQWWDAQVLEHEDRELDIAVLSVYAQELEVPVLPWHLGAHPEILRAGNSLRPIGFPRGSPWFVPQQRHLFHSVTTLHVGSEGELDPGNSGGALVSEDWRIVGIVTQADRPNNWSARIDLALARLEKWGYQVNLWPERGTRPSVQRTVNTYEPAKVLEDVRPEYPSEAKAARAEGTVELSYVVDTNGRATEIKVVQPVHPLLDAAAMEALKQWRFAPALKLGEPVASKMTAAMTFSLK
jgi:TonB family protein